MTDDSLDDPVVYDVEHLVLDTLRQETPLDPPARIDPGHAAPVAVWRGRDVGAVAVLSRRGDGTLADDIFVVPASRDGRWEDLPGYGGGEAPEWVLHRPVSTPPEWNHRPIVVLDLQVAAVNGPARPGWAVAFLLMAAQDVDAIAFDYGRHHGVLPVPPNGLTLFAAAVDDADDTATFWVAPAGEPPTSPLVVPPFTDVDRRIGWPSPDFWAPNQPR